MRQSLLCQEKQKYERLFLKACPSRGLYALVVMFTLTVTIFSLSTHVYASSVVTSPNVLPTYTRYQIILIINHVFGTYGAQAVKVATCEFNLDPNAHQPVPNGGMGLFQIIPSSLQISGNSNPYDPTANAQAAFLLFALSGYSWAPWSCKP